MLVGVVLALARFSEAFLVLRAQSVGLALATLLGTGFGVFNLASGGALLLASVIAGWFWSSLGPSATFLAGAAFATTAAIGLLVRPCCRA